MYRMLRMVLAVPIFSSCMGFAFAANFYVSGTGSDNNSGSSATQAWRTPAHAAAIVNPGDTVWFMTGTYAPFKLTRSGTGSAPIVWKASSGSTAEIISATWAAIEVRASYQVIDGLTLTGNNDHVTLAQAEADYEKDAPDPAFNGNGITLDNRNRADKYHHLTVRNCTVRKFGGGGIVSIEADYNVMEANRIYENAWYSRYGASGATIFPHNSDSRSGYRNVIRGNKLWNNRGLVRWKAIKNYSDGNGFILDITADDYSGRTLVIDNVAVNNGGSGLHAYKARRADFFNNTAYMNGDKVGYADIYASYSVDVRIMNNVVYSRDGGKANTNSSNSNVVYDYNVYFKGTRAVTGPHDVVADPLFIRPGRDLGSADFHLKKESPAIDTGIRVDGTSSTRDIAGVIRPQGIGVDRGAYEYVPPTSTASPAPPPVTAPVLPTGWSQAAMPGSRIDSVVENNGTWMLRGRSGDVWGTQDSIIGTWREVKGDFSLSARLVSMSSEAEWAKAGVALRESASATARQAATTVTRQNGIAFLHRAQTGGSTTYTAGGKGKAPYWVRLQRAGNVLSAWQSADGKAWTLIRRQQTALSSVVQVGLISATGGQPSEAAADATFTNVTLDLKPVAQGDSK